MLPHSQRAVSLCGVGVGVGICVITRAALDEWILTGQMETVTQILEVVMDQELAFSSWIMGSQKGIRGVWGR